YQTGPGDGTARTMGNSYNASRSMWWYGLNTNDVYQNDMNVISSNTFGYASLATGGTASREGVLLSFYVAVVGVTLLYLHTGHRPSKYLFIMLGMVANGSATLDEIMPILRERERQCQMQRDRVARKRAEKTK